METVIVSLEFVTVSQDSWVLTALEVRAHTHTLTYLRALCQDILFHQVIFLINYK